MSAGGQVLSSVFSGLFNKQAATTAFHRQKALMDKQYNQNQQSLRDSPLSALEGYRNAGLNAGAMLGQGAPQAAPVSGGNADQASPMDTSGIANAMQSAANIRLTNAQRENVEADTTGKNIRNALDQKYGEGDRSLNQQVLNSQAQMNLGYLRNANANARNMEIINQTADQIQQAALRKLQLEGNYQSLANSLKSQENSWYGIRMQQEIDESISRVANNAAETAYLKAYVPLLGAMARNQNAQADLANTQDKLTAKQVGNFDEEFYLKVKEVAAVTHELYTRSSLHESDAALRDAQERLQNILAEYMPAEKAAEIALKYSEIAKNGAETVESASRTVNNVRDGFLPKITEKDGISSRGVGYNERTVVHH